MAGARGRPRRGRATAFRGCAGAPDPALLPLDAATAPDGAIVELAPARTALMEAIAARIAANGGAGLFIDYGHLQSGVGDTLQAVKAHRYEDVLASPGEADLTAHVDFAALAASAARAWARGISHHTGRLPARHGIAGACRAPRRGRRRCGAPETAGRGRAPCRPRCDGHAVQGAGNCAARRSAAALRLAPIDLHPCPAAVSRPGTRIGTARRQVS